MCIKKKWFGQLHSATWPHHSLPSHLGEDLSHVWSSSTVLRHDHLASTGPPGNVAVGHDPQPPCWKDLLNGVQGGGVRMKKQKNNSGMVIKTCCHFMRLVECHIVHVHFISWMAILSPVCFLAWFWPLCGRARWLWPVSLSCLLCRRFLAKLKQQCKWSHAGLDCIPTLWLSESKFSMSKYFALYQLYCNQGF